MDRCKHTNWVISWILGASAGVLVRWASLSGGGLGWSIIDRITTGATALEGVEETEPVANLMGSSLSLIVVGSGTAGDRTVQDLATVLVECIGSLGGDLGWELADSKKTVAERSEVDVQILVGPLAQSLLHRQLGGPIVQGAMRSPGLVDGKVCSEEVEMDTSRLILIVQSFVL